MVRLVGPHRHLDGMRPHLVLFGSSSRGLGVEKKAQSQGSGMDEGQRQNPIKVGNRTIKFFWLVYFGSNFKGSLIKKRPTSLNKDPSALGASLL